MDGGCDVYVAMIVVVMVMQSCTGDQDNWVHGD